MEEAEILCDRLAIMDHGRILEMGTVEELVSKHFQERTVRFDRLDGLAHDELAALPAVSSVKEDASEVLIYTRDPGRTIGGAAGPGRLRAASSCRTSGSGGRRSRTSSST